MSKRIVLLLLLTVLGMLQLPVRAQDLPNSAKQPVQNVAPAEPPAITIYNANFAVVREVLPLNLSSGLNALRFSGITAHVEPDSVMLRDPLATRQLQIWEQNYRNDPVTQELLLSLYEGQTITFRTGRGGDLEYVKGKVIRAGYVPRMTSYNDPYVQAGSTPIVEVDGQLQFSLPGQPMFPSLIGDTVLKPSMNWLVQTDKPGKLDAELSYVTSGLSWEADYNLVAPEKGDTIDLVGWVTIQNHSGTVFDNARIKLMAGDVNKIQPNATPMMARAVMKEAMAMDAAAPPVTEKSFDEFHLYSLQHPTTLHDQETKQVQFVSATGVRSNRFYLYDGSRDTRYSYYWQVGNDPDYGTQSNPKVAVMQEFVNSEANHLGIALPKGRLRFYRRDSDGHLEFTGENTIDHTPKDETIRVYTGNAFDITGERRRTDFHVDSNQRWVDETYQVKVRNHKKEAVNVRVLEHLYRWSNWKLTAQSDQYRKIDSRNIEFRVQVPPDGEKVVTYTVHYSW